MPLQGHILLPETLKRYTSPNQTSSIVDGLQFDLPNMCQRCILIMQNILIVRRKTSDDCASEAPWQKVKFIANIFIPKSYNQFPMVLKFILIFAYQVSRILGSSIEYVSALVALEGTNLMTDHNVTQDT
jgi:hypothetical protein